MFRHLLPHRRRQARRESAALADRRSGAPALYRPAPMPRMRWYS
jgi:hypothetical protein